MFIGFGITLGFNQRLKRQTKDKNRSCDNKSKISSYRKRRLNHAADRFLAAQSFAAVMLFGLLCRWMLLLINAVTAYVSCGFKVC